MLVNLADPIGATCLQQLVDLGICSLTVQQVSCNKWVQMWVILSVVTILFESQRGGTSPRGFSKNSQLSRTAVATTTVTTPPGVGSVNLSRNRHYFPWRGRFSMKTNVFRSKVGSGSMPNPKMLDPGCQSARTKISGALGCHLGMLRRSENHWMLQYSDVHWDAEIYVRLGRRLWFFLNNYWNTCRYFQASIQYACHQHMAEGTLRVLAFSEAGSCREQACNRWLPLSSTVAQNDTL